MKKITLSLLFISALLLLSNWAKETSETAGDKKQRINFYGTIITVGNQDKAEKINNISAANIYKQIPVYVAPTTFTKDINPKTHTISANPKDILQQVRIDLAEIKEIKTKRIEGEPVIWEYKEKNGKQKGKIRREFIELIVTSNDDTKNNYLIELRKNLRFDIKNAAGPMESKLNFKGLIKLTIEGYTDRDLEKKEKLEKRKRKGKKGLNHKYKKGLPTK
ncbi:hypothetical protein ACFLYU_01185 [Candidatus Dependentiae bacterium]